MGSTAGRERLHIGRSPGLHDGQKRKNKAEKQQKGAACLPPVLRRCAAIPMHSLCARLWPYDLWRDDRCAIAVIREEDTRAVSSGENEITAKDFEIIPCPVISAKSLQAYQQPYLAIQMRKIKPLSAHLPRAPARFNSKNCGMSFRRGVWLEEVRVLDASDPTQHAACIRSEL